MRSIEHLLGKLLNIPSILLMTLKPLKLYGNEAWGDSFVTATPEGEQSARDAGYKFLRVEGYVLDGPAPGTSPPKLFWGPARQDNFTTATAEGEQIALDHGWVFIRIEGYVYKDAQPGTVPLKLYWSESKGDNFTTGTEEGNQSAVADGYQFIRTEGYIHPSTETNGAQRSALTNLIIGIPKLPMQASSVTPVGSAEVRFANHHGTASVVSSQMMRETANFLAPASFDPNADVLWPGSLVQGSSLHTGVLSPIAVARSPITITLTNLMIANGESHPEYSKEIANPSLATTRAAIQELLQQHFSPTAAYIGGTIDEYHSTEHGLLKIGVDAHWVSADVKAALEVGRERDKTNMIIDFRQLYFSIAASPPVSPTSFVADPVDMAALSRYMGAANPPVYVASITYGRRLLMFVTSSAATDKLMAALHAAVKLPLANGTVDMTAEYQEIVNNSSIRLMILGGSASSAVKVMTDADKVRAINAYIEAGATMSVESPGVPISYNLRYLADNDIAALSLTTDYSVESYRKQRIDKVRVSFILTDDDLDLPEKGRLSVFHGGQLVGHGEFGEGVVWKDPGEYPCDIVLTGSATDLEVMSVEMYKTPYGSPTGCGMEGKVQGWYILEDGTENKWFDIPERRYGDNNPYHVVFKAPNVVISIE